MQTRIVLFWIILFAPAISQIEAATIHMVEPSAYKVWFDYPKPHQNVSAGADLTVRISAWPSSHIKSVTLYHNGKIVGTDGQYPFRWEYQSAGYTSLRNLPQGSHKLKISILHMSGQITHKECKFYAVKRGGADPSPQPAKCDIGNPLQNLRWLRTLRKHNQKIIIEQYASGGHTLFKIRYCHKLYVRQWFDCEGKLIGSDRVNLIRRAKKVKTLYDGCKVVIKPYSTAMITN